MFDCPSVISAQRPAGWWLYSSNVCIHFFPRNNWRGTGERLSLPWHKERVCGWLPAAATDEGSRPEWGKFKLLSVSLSWWLPSHPSGKGVCKRVDLYYAIISDFSVPRYSSQTLSDFSTIIILMSRCCAVDKGMKNNLQAKFVEKL